MLPDLRDVEDRLIPAPTEALDGAVQAWTAHLETIVFECSIDDRAALEQQFHRVDVLAAEIDAGLVADEQP